MHPAFLKLLQAMTDPYEITIQHTIFCKHKNIFETGQVKSASSWNNLWGKLSSEPI
jgi:hypothetical protein